MKKRPPGRQDGLSTNCTVTRRGLLVAPTGWLRAAYILKGPMRERQKKEEESECFKDRIGCQEAIGAKETEGNLHKRRWSVPPQSGAGI